MGMIRSSVIFCILVVLYTYISTLLEQELPVNVDGNFHPAFNRVAEIFRESIESNRKPGVAFAVYHNGDLVFDMWGGYADYEAHVPWSRDTITLGYSTTKGIAAIVVAKMVEMGHLNYSRPIAHYWPEFAQQEKGNITVEMFMSHQAGLPYIDEPIQVRDIKENPGKVEQILARQKTVWPAGRVFGYHTVTFGPYVDTLVRKADPKGRDMTEIFKQDIADVHGLDLWMNTPKDQYYRSARINQDPLWKFLLKAYMVPKYAKMFTNFILFPSSMFAKSTQTVMELTEPAVVHNNPYMRDAPLSSAFSSGTARSYAKLYGILANGGTNNGKKLLSDKSINTLATPIVSAVDMVADLNASYSTGMQIVETPKGGTSFGHPGHGGQMAVADLENGLGIAYLTNYIDVYAQGDHPRYLRLLKEVYACLEDYVKSKQ